MQDWFASIRDGSVTTMYKTIKTDFAYSNYFKMINVPKFRYSFSRFVCGSHRLPIVTGRWARPKVPRNQRLCSLCNTLYDEYHFILECKNIILCSLRNSYIPKYYYSRPSMYKFTLLFNSQDTKIIRNLAMYIHKGLSIL